MTSPSSGSGQANPFTLTANATDNVAIAQVQFFQTTGKCASPQNSPQSYMAIGNPVTTSPYTITTNLTSSFSTNSVCVAAQAKDTSGNMTWSNYVVLYVQ